MKKIYPFLLLACLSVVAKAQTAASYIFSRATGTFTSIAGASGTNASYAISIDDGVLTNIPIGFSFTYGGNTSTQVSASSNGWMSLSNSGLATGSGTYTNSLGNLPLNNGGVGVLMPFWDDLNGSSATAYYQTSGTAPNRVFTFQWGEPSAGWGNLTGSGSATFQIRLYESSNVIEFVYGTTSYSGNSASIGIANSGTDYLMLASETSTTASTSFSTSAGASPTANTVLTWTPPPTIAASPSSLTFVEGVGVTSAAQNVTLQGYGLTSASVSVTAPANYEIYDGASWATSMTVAVSTAALGTYVNTVIPTRFVAPSTAAAYTGNLSFASSGATTVNVALTGHSTLPCSGAPTVGTIAASPSGGSSATVFNLSLSGYTVAGGITFQWQSSPDNATWTNIAGATNTSYSFSGMTSGTYYRAEASCGTSTSASTSVYLTYVPAPACLPTSSSWYSEDAYNIVYSINTFDVTGFGGSTLSDAGMIAAANTSTGYIDRTSMAPLTLQQGGTYAANITWGSVSNHEIGQVWIDFDNDGTFAVSEEVSPVFGWDPSTPPNPAFFNLTIPVTAATGTHLMRIRGIWEYNWTDLGYAPPHIDPCLDMYGGSYPQYYSGDVADYYVNIVALPPCSGTPSGITVNASQDFGCSTYTAALSLSGVSAAGLTFQWQSSPDSLTWTNVAGATSTTYSASVSSSVYYRCIITCPSSSGTMNTPGKQLVFSATVSLPYSQSFEGISASNTLPPCMDATGLGSYTYTYMSATGYNNMYAHTGSKYASFGYYANDWFFTPGFNVTAGNTYVISFWYITDGYSGWNSLSASWGTSQTSSGMTTPIGTAVAYPSNTTYAQYTATVTATSTGVYYVGINCDNTWGSNLSIDDINIVELPSCTGTPSGITPTASQTYGCSPYSSTLALAGLSSSGFTYQWESSSDSLTWTTVSGATNSTYAASVSTSVYYRCIVTCAASSSSFTTAGLQLIYSVTAAIPYFESFEGISSTNSLPPCMDATNLGYITSTYTSSPGSYNRYAMTGSKFGSFRYGSDDWFFTPAFSLTAGNTYVFSFWYITDGYSGWGPLQAMYGTSQSASGMTAVIGTPVSSPSNTSYAQYTGTFTATSSGNFYIGINCSDNGSPWYLSIDDISLTQLPPCTGTPSGISPTASKTFGCSTYSSLLGLSGVTTSGFTYQWESSSDSLAWSSVSGATNSTYSASVSTDVYYRCIVGCPAGGSTFTTAGIKLGFSVTAAIPYSEGFESITSNNELPPCMDATSLGYITSTYASSPGSYNRIAHTGSKFGSYRYGSDDWFFTPAFALTAGNSYVFSFWYITDGYSGWGPLQAMYGTSQSAAGMTTIIGTPVANPGNTTYAQYTGTFTATSSGNFYIGINCQDNGSPWYLSIDDINLVQLPPCSGTPAAGTVSSSVSYGCGTVTPTLTLSGTTTGVSGLSYQWQSSPDNATWSNMAGATTMTYTAATSANTYYRSEVSCGTATDQSTSTMVSVNPAPAEIDGGYFVCLGGTTSLSSSTAGGTWTSDNTSIVSIDASGIATGLAAGTAAISYTLSTGCAAATVINVSTVSPTVSASSSAPAICYGEGVSLTAAPVLTLPAYDVATIPYAYTTQTSPTLVTGFTGMDDGYAAISLPFPFNFYGTDYNTAYIGTNGYISFDYGTSDNSNYTLPVSWMPPLIAYAMTDVIITNQGSVKYSVEGVAPNRVFVVSFNHLTNWTWWGSTDDDYDAQIKLYETTNAVDVLVSNATSGYLTIGIQDGISQATTPDGRNGDYFGIYSYAPEAYRFFPPKDAYTWSPSTYLASTTGTAVTASAITSSGPTETFTVTRTYNGCASNAVATVTLNPLPAIITGTTNVCAGLTTALNTASAGGTWQSSIPANATVDPATGVVTGVLAGTSEISYTFTSTGCSNTQVVTVNALPDNILGTAGVCSGSTTTLTDATMAGAWSSGTPAVAAVDASGVVTGGTAGVAMITYTLPTGCIATREATVNPLPSINITPASAPAICEGESVSFSVSSPVMEFSLLSQDFNSGLGLWTITTPQDPADGISPWIWTTTPISGPGDGSALVEANPAYGSGATVTETILTSPAFSTMGYGSAELTFNQNLQSTSSADLNVEVQYSVDGGATWSLLLDEMNAASGSGVWVASSPEISIPLPAAALNVPDVRIRWYYQSNFGLWWQVDNIAVKAALPAATFTWTGVGGAIGLSCTSCATATMTPATSGTNVYNVTASSTCSANTSITVSVNPLPGLITSSAATLCMGNTVTLSSPDAGGNWASDNTAIATVDPVTGEATGMAMGSVVISYTLPTNCARAVTLNVDPSPAPITGTLQVCTGLTTSLANAVTGGVWTNIGTNASVDAATGVVFGNTAGTSMITYELPSGCKTSSEVTVNPLPAPITGVTGLCIGSSTTLASAPAGGTWDVAAIAPVTVGATGVVTGVTAGVTEVTYTLPAGCSQTAMVTVNALPSVYYVTGSGSYCAGGTGTPVGLTWSQTGVDYQLYMGATPIGSPVTGTGSAISFGPQLAGTYTVAAINSASCADDMGGSAVITATPVVVPAVTLATAPGTTVCAGTAVTYSATPVDGGTLPVYDWEVNGLPVSGASSATYSYAPASGDIVKVTLNSNAACATPSTAVYTATVTVDPNETPVATIAFTGDTSVCEGNSITLGVTSVFGGTAPVYHWMVNGTVMSTGTSYSYVPVAGDIVSCELTSNFTCVTSPVDTSNVLAMAVTPVYVPILGITVAPGSVIAPGTSVTFTAAVAAGTAGPLPTYQWYKGSSLIVGATNSTYTTTTIADNDSITCKVTGTAPCGEVAFNSVLMKVKSVGLQQVTGNIGNVRLIPNPNNGEFIITGTLSGTNDDQVAVEITNMLGQTVYSGRFIAKGGDFNEKIRLSNTLANGMYMLNMHSGSQMEVIHFVLEQ